METTIEKETLSWVKAIEISEVPEEGGANVFINGLQIAIFNFTSKREWYATQNMCPHRKEMALSRGMIGDKKGEPKVACPFHKKTFSLESGKCLNDPNYEIKTYNLKFENGWIYIEI